MSENKFEWTDDLVMQAINSMEERISIYNLRKYLQEFKKSKEKDIPKDLGYEIFVLEDKTITGAIRLSDGKIFEIGDEVKWMWFVSPKEYITIEGFYLDEEKRLIVKFKEWDAADQLFHIIMYMGFEKKVKQKLFTTEDGCPIFYGDDFYFVNDRFNLHEGDPAHSDSGKNKTFKYFSTEEKAKEYIIENKTVEVSCKEIDKLFAGTLGYQNFNRIIRDFFKSKINI